MSVSTAGGPGGGMPPDSTNAGMADSGAGPSGAASSLSGEHTTAYAITRLKKAQQAQQAIGKVAPPAILTAIRRF